MALITSDIGGQVVNIGVGLGLPWLLSNTVEGEVLAANAAGTHPLAAHLFVNAATVTNETNRTIIQARITPQLLLWSSHIGHGERTSCSLTAAALAAGGGAPRPRRGPAADLVPRGASTGPVPCTVEPSLSFRNTVLGPFLIASH